MSHHSEQQLRTLRVRGRTRTLQAALVALSCLAAIQVIPGALAADPAIDRLLSSSTLLQAGQTGRLVADLQATLQVLGFDPGPVDGAFGPRTDAAVRAFQAEAAIPVDGRVGPTTRRSIAAVTEVAPAGNAHPTLRVGDRGSTVVTLQRQLTAARLYRGPLDGAFGPMTASAVVAFHKVGGLERTSTWQASDWDRIAGWYPSAPGYGSAAFRIEVDLERQVLFVVRDGSVTAVMPVSTASGETYTSLTGQQVRARTPRGDFVAFRNVDGWDRSYLGDLYEPWYFSGGYAIHGSTSVPVYPASHGCIRVSIADSVWLDARMWIGMPVHVGR